MQVELGRLAPCALAPPRLRYRQQRPEELGRRLRWDELSDDERQLAAPWEIESATFRPNDRDDRAWPRQRWRAWLRTQVEAGLVMVHGPTCRVDDCSGCTVEAPAP